MVVFYSAYSHHMTPNKSFFTKFIEFDGENTTHGDGNVVRMKGIGTVYASSIPNLEEVIL